LTHQSAGDSSPITRRRRRRRESDPSIQPLEVRGALQRLIASPDFAATERNRRFLSYVVEKTLEGKFDDISGYHVATLVFGRPASFNPTLDPIVRIEAGKLRRDLEVYYLKSGRQEVVRISLPRGSYIPVFERHAAPSFAPAAVLDPLGITVHAIHSEDHAANGNLRARVVDELTRTGEIAVYAAAVAPSNDHGLLDSETARALGERNGTRFVFSGHLRPNGDALTLTARLHDGATGRQLWSEDLEGAEIEKAVVTRLLEVRRRLAAEVVSPSAAGAAASHG